MRYFIVIILSLWPWVAQAGPWPRQPGQVYAALSSSHAQGRQYHGFYTEWGTPNGLTMGMDIGADSHGRSAKLISFIRWPVGQGRTSLRYSLDAGIGRFGDLGVLRFGAAMGAGMPVFGRDSWWVLDGQLLRPAAHSAPDSQAQALWGLHVGPRHSLILALQAGQDMRGRSHARFAPSWVFSLGARGAMRLELGLLQGLNGPRSSGVKIALWQSR